VKELFLISPLALPCLFFLFHFRPWPPILVGLILLAWGLTASEFGGSWRFDEWLKGLQETFHAPNPWVLVMTQERYPSKLATFFLPEHWESVPYPDHFREHFGMILVDQSAPYWSRPVKYPIHGQAENLLPFTDEMIKYCFRALVKGGRLVIVEKRRPVIVFMKNGD